MTLPLNVQMCVNLLAAKNVFSAALFMGI